MFMSGNPRGVRHARPRHEVAGRTRKPRGHRDVQGWGGELCCPRRCRYSTSLRKEFVFVARSCTAVVMLSSVHSVATFFDSRSSHAVNILAFLLLLASLLLVGPAPSFISYSLLDVPYHAPACPYACFVFHLSNLNSAAVCGTVFARLGSRA